MTINTIEQLESLEPCREMLEWAKQQPSLYDAWETCNRGSWLWWLLAKLDRITPDMAIEYAKWCDRSLAQCKNSPKQCTSKFYDPSIYTIAYMGDYSWYCALMFPKQHQTQADFLRTLAPNPFTK